MSDSIRLVARPFDVEIRNEPTYSFASADKQRSYQHEYGLTGGGYQFTSRHGVRCWKDGEVVGSAVLGASGGATGVHDSSAVIARSQCFVAVGPCVAALALPTLALVWSTEVDAATCFGVYSSSDTQALISHGELEVARLTFGGAVVWTAGGADIFTEGFQIDRGVIRVLDFEKRSYNFDEKTGRELA